MMVPEQDSHLEQIDGQRYYSTDTMYGQYLMHNPYLPIQQQQQNSIRTVYISNIPVDLLVSDIMDQVKTGAIQAIRPFPEKNGLFITFVDSISAGHFYHISTVNSFIVLGHNLKIGWGRPNSMTTSIHNALQNGASRNVYLGLLEPDINENQIRQDLSRFGHIEHIKLISEKRIAFIHFLCITNAVKCVNTLPTESQWQAKRINFGKDRCAQKIVMLPPSNYVLGQQHTNYTFTSIPPNITTTTTLIYQHDLISKRIAGIAHRTIYLGNIHPDTTSEDICNVIRGGILSQIRFIPDKNIAFITFVDPTLAENFFNSNEYLVIKNRRLKLGWGKPSALPFPVINAVQNGGSRNVYIGNINDFITEEKLKHDFSEYGEIELVNTLREKNCAFVNFTSITGALRAIEGIQTNQDYSNFRISYGKDRCGNPPRFNQSVNYDDILTSTTSSALIQDGIKFE